MITNVTNRVLYLLVNSILPGTSGFLCVRCNKLLIILNAPGRLHGRKEGTHKYQNKREG